MAVGCSGPDGAHLLVDDRLLLRVLTFARHALGVGLELHHPLAVRVVRLKHGVGGRRARIHDRDLKRPPHAPSLSIPANVRMIRAYLPDRTDGSHRYGAN